MEILFFSVIKLILAAGLILVVVLVIIRYYFSFKKMTLPSQSADQSDDQKIILPLRLQAYERIVLFLDRISVNNLILRINRPDMNALQLQAALVSSIRDEFEYNLSQQLYISSKSWAMVKSAKEETIRLINTASMKVAESAPSAEMVRILLQLSLSEDKSAVDEAIDQVKKDIHPYF